MYVYVFREYCLQLVMYSVSGQGVIECKCKLLTLSYTDIFVCGQTHTFFTIMLSFIFDINKNERTMTF